MVDVAGDHRHRLAGDLGLRGQLVQPLVERWAVEHARETVDHGFGAVIDIRAHQGSRQDGNRRERYQQGEQRIDGRKRMARLHRDGDHDHEHADEGHAGADSAGAEARGQCAPSGTGSQHAV